MDREQLQIDIHRHYRREHEELGAVGTLAMLERAADFPLAPTLNAGGVLVFPHAGVKDCGYQIAACVRACLESGADRVLVISVLHAFSDAMEEARQRVSGGADPRLEALWGIQGPGLEGREEWRGDHALYSWRHFWRAELERRGIDESRMPQVIERYPYLAGGRPGDLPGIEELARLAEDAVIVSTADAFHHGIGYGDAPEEAMWPDEQGLARAHQVLQEGMAILGEGDYWGYDQHCVAARSDARDAGQVFSWLRGPMSGRVLDLTFTDSSEIYNQPAPTWVVAALMEWTLNHGV
ncbi:MAG: hypothetical protein J4G17_09095 [Anaerolineae bacterium]|nr:hypothetical protein [Anaerolineae bacterium]